MSCPLGHPAGRCTGRAVGQPDTPVSTRSRDRLAWNPVEFSYTRVPEELFTGSSDFGETPLATFERQIDRGTMRLTRRAIAVLLLLTSVQYTLVWQNRGCVPSETPSRPTIAASPSVHHASHRESQHRRGEHSRQHCLTSVNCISSLSPDTAVEASFSPPLSREEQVAALPPLRNLPTEPTTPPPRS